MEDAAQAAAAPGVPGAPAPGRRVWPPRRQVLPNRSNIPAQQRLLPMPTFGRQPVAVVAGQVVEASPEGAEIIQGRIERGPWHETDLEIPADMQLERGSTGQLVSKYRGLGRTLMVNSVVIITLYFLTSAAFFYFSNDVPRTCNVDFSSTFIWLGGCEAILGLTMTCFLGVAYRMLWALYHGEIAQKYRFQCRDEEADSEESDFEEQATLARHCLLVPRFIYCLATVSTLLLWLTGVYQAMSAKEQMCGRSAEVFWLLAFIMMATTCYASVDSSGRSTVSL